MNDSDSGSGAGQACLTRDYRPDDAAALARLFRDAVRRTAAAAYSPAEIAAWASAADDTVVFAARLAEGWVRVAVSEDGQIIGFGEISPPGHIGMLFTAPAFGRQGVAGALLGDLLLLAAAMGASQVTADVSRCARAFFLRHGFAELRLESVERGGVAMERYVMSRAVPLM